MAKLDQLQPQSVFYYFEQLCAIPHGSGNVQAISDYCVAFAKAHHLPVTQDALGNIIITKEATAGYEHSPAVMIQGHLDMVCVADPARSTIDMATDGLELVVEGDTLRANGTSLGGDDGIAVAYGLALLAASDLAHPKLEVVFTVDEEIGLIGAAAIDLSGVTAKRLINIDSENEHEVLTSCAGGATAKINLPVARTTQTGQLVTLTVDGLLGGHSGVEIDKGRGNASKLMGRFLYALQQQIVFGLVELQGGSADNVIPSRTVAEVLIDPCDLPALTALVAGHDACYKRELQTTDGGVQLTLTVGKTAAVQALTLADSNRVVGWLQLVPNGIQTMSGAIDGLVESSLNLGILKLHDTALQAGFSVRSALQSLKEEQFERLQNLTTLFAGECSIHGSYPAWEYKADSVLRDCYCAVYREHYQADIQVSAIHAGLECGFFAGKIADLDCIAIGPNMKDIHSVNETLSISSVANVWTLLIALLKRLK